MAKKTTVPAVSTLGFASGAAVPWSQDISAIIQREDISPSEKRKALLVKLELRQTRRKYKTKAQRTAAAKTRRDKRKTERLSVFEQYGLEPKTRGPKLTAEEKRKKRSTRGKTRRSLFREMARANPEMAKKYGVDPSRFKL